MRWMILACLIVACLARYHFSKSTNHYFSNSDNSYHPLSKSSKEYNRKCYSFRDSTNIYCLESYILPSSCRLSGRDTVVCTTRTRRNDFSTLSRRRARIRGSKLRFPGLFGKKPGRKVWGKTPKPNPPRRPKSPGSSKPSRTTTNLNNKLDLNIDLSPHLPQPPDQQQSDQQ